MTVHTVVFCCVFFGLKGSTVTDNRIDLGSNEHMMLQNRMLYVCTYSLSIQNDQPYRGECYPNNLIYIFMTYNIHKYLTKILSHYSRGNKSHPQRLLF